MSGADPLAYPIASRHVRPNLMDQGVHLAPDVLQRRMVVRIQCPGAFALELPDLCLDCRLVDALDGVVFCHVDVERPSQRREESILVHLRVALDGLVLNALGHVSQLCDGLVPELLIGVRHVYLLAES